MKTIIEIVSSEHINVKITKIVDKDKIIDQSITSETANSQRVEQALKHFIIGGVLKWGYY